MITINALSLTLEGKTILDDISLSLAPGSLHCFIGPSGAGKTSLLRCMGSLYPQHAGSIEYYGNSLKTMDPLMRAQMVGFIFQQFNLFPHMTVLGNCTHPLIHVFKVPKEEAQHQALQLLASMGIEQLANQYPNQLSGGQQQRVAIARALCPNPKVLICDEPTSSLDPENCGTLIALFKDLTEKGVTIIISSHDISFIKALNSSVYYIRKGKCLESYTPLAQQDPAPRMIASFLNYTL